MKMKLFLGILLAGIMGLASCSDYLDETPDKSGSAYIYHMDQLYGLMGSVDLYLNSSPTFYNYPGIGDYPFWGNYWQEQYLLSDAVEMIPEYYLYGVGYPSNSLYDVYSFGTEQLIDNSGTMGLTWTPSYERIYRFNTVLENLDKVVQTTEAIHEQVKGEALFGRAYFHFLILEQYCLWNEDAPGIGYRDATDPNGIPDRQTVGYTLSRIYQDLDDAEEALTNAGRSEFDFEHNFRPTVPTVQAFRARVALYRGDYETALANAENALKAHSTLVTFKDDPDYALQTSMQIQLVDSDSVPTGNVLEMKMMLGLYYNTSLAIPAYEELFLPHISCANYYGIIPMSESFYNVWTDKENDARWIHFYGNGYEGLGLGLGKMLFQKDGMYCFPQNPPAWMKKSSYYAYNRFFGYAELMGMTTAEMYLIKAECEARLGVGNPAETLQTLRRTRFYDQAAADNIGGGIQDVLDERYREMGAFWRFYDIKRLNGAENAGIHVIRRIMTDPTDISSVTTIDIAPDDPRWALPFNKQDVDAMGWEQNPGWD